MKNQKQLGKVFTKLFCGSDIPRNKPVKNLYKRQIKILHDIYNSKNYNDFGIERILRLFCAAIQFVSFANLVRHLFGKFGFKARKLSVEIYMILNTIFPLFIIKYGLWDNNVLLFIMTYLLIETMLYLLNLVVLSPDIPKPASYTRNFISLFFNYFQLAFIFAVYYLRVGLDTNKIKIVYFSIVTQTTVGYGDIHPQNTEQFYISIIHISLSLLFVYMFFAYFISNIGKDTFMNKKDEKKKK